MRSGSYSGLRTVRTAVRARCCGDAVSAAAASRHAKPTHTHHASPTAAWLAARP